MTKFRKFIFVGIAVVTLGGASISAFADKEHCGTMGHDAQKQSARMEKHQARLHDKLKLTADQESAWKTYADKTKHGASENRPDWSELSALPSPERMERMLSLMKERQGRMEERLAALKTFYAVLTREQQKLFDEQHSKHGTSFIG